MRIVLQVVALACLTALFGCTTDAPFEEHRDWAFIQSVGGIAVKMDGKKMDVTCDVSGLHKVTIKPTLMNSGLALKKLEHDIKGTTVIRIWVVTGVFQPGDKTSAGSIDLSGVPPGNYEVHYLNPDRTEVAFDIVNVP